MGSEATNVYEVVIVLLPHLDAFDVIRLSTCSKGLARLCHSQLSAGKHGVVSQQVLRNTVAARPAGTCTFPLSISPADQGERSPSLYTQALAWLCGQLAASGAALSADTVEMLVLNGSPYIPSCTAQALVVAGMRVSYAQLVSAAQRSVPDTVKWPGIQRSKKITTDIPEYAEALACGGYSPNHPQSWSWNHTIMMNASDRVVPQTLSASELSNLMFIAINSRNTYYSTGTGCKLKYVQVVLNMALQHPAAHVIPVSVAAELISAALDRDVEQCYRDVRHHGLPIGPILSLVGCVRQLPAVPYIPFSHMVTLLDSMMPLTIEPIQVVEKLVSDIQKARPDWQLNKESVLQLIRLILYAGMKQQMQPTNLSLAKVVSAVGRLSGVYRLQLRGADIGKVLAAVMGETAGLPSWQRQGPGQYKSAILRAIQRAARQ